MSPVPLDVDWYALSPRSREIGKVIGLRMAAGHDAAEIARKLTEERPALRYLKLPEGRVKKTWVLQRVAELRREIEDTPGLASF